MSTNSRHCKFWVGLELSMGFRWFMRSGALKGLRADRKGANPFLHLAAGHVLADPEAWTIFQSVRDARELGGFERVEACLGLFATASEDLPRNGPAAILVARLQRLGWTFGAN